jgi:RND family efflux transporter MFP subunit
MRRDAARNITAIEIEPCPSSRTGRRVSALIQQGLPMIRKLRRPLTLVTGVALLGVAGVWMSTRASARTDPASAQQVQERASQIVTATRPVRSEWSRGLAARGNIGAWQEMSVGSELGGLRVAEVRSDVGDHVRRGQVLARLASDVLAADLQRREAAQDEAHAALAEAHAAAEGARELANSGALSSQQTTQYLTAESTARARAKSADAALLMAQISLRQANVVAPDDGIVLSRGVTVGAVASVGQELFKLQRQGRLEWRAEVGADDLVHIAPGQAIDLLATNGIAAHASVRLVAPSVDTATRTAIVYADVPAGSGLRPGMFATGRFVLGDQPAITVPQDAVVARDGFAYVFVIGTDSHVTQTPVTIGRRQGDRIELTSGVGVDTLLAEQGAGFLGDRDVVHLATAMSSARQTAPAASSVAR